MQLIENNFVYILEILYKYDRICKILCMVMQKK